MYYRFSSGNFVEAETFEEAKEKAIKSLEDEIEYSDNWCSCTCLGFDHRFDCHMVSDEDTILIK